MIPRLLFPTFTALYVAALALYAWRLLCGRKQPAVVAQWLLVCAFTVHTLFLIGRARAAIAAHGAPLSNWHEWCVVAAWIATAGYLLLTWSRVQEWQALLVLPPVVALLAMAWLLPPDASFATERAMRFWGMLHGSFLLLGTVTVALGFSAGVMYLVQADRLKRKLPAVRGFRLPSLETAGRLNERLLIWSVFLLMSGLLAGWLLNLIPSGQQGGGLPWSDPTVLTSTVLFVWLVAATIFALFYEPARVGRKVAYLTVASFVLLALTLAVVFFGPSSHTRRSPQADTQATAMEWHP